MIVSYQFALLSHRHYFPSLTTFIHTYASTVVFQNEKAAMTSLAAPPRSRQIRSVRASCCTHRNNARGATSCTTPLRDRIRDAVAASLTSAMLFISAPGAEAARNLESVNRPDLLPSGTSSAAPVTVLDPAGFLTDGEEARLIREIASLERDTGFKLRVLGQVRAFLLLSSINQSIDSAFSNIERERERHVTHTRTSVSVHSGVSSHAGLSCEGLLAG